MDPDTINAYDADAANFARRYNQTNMAGLHPLLLRHLAAPKANNQKRDKLVAREALFQSQEHIVDCWQHVQFNVKCRSHHEGHEEREGVQHKPPLSQS